MDKAQVIDGMVRLADGFFAGVTYPRPTHADVVRFMDQADEQVTRGLPAKERPRITPSDRRIAVDAVVARIGQVAT